MPRLRRSTSGDRTATVSTTTGMRSAVETVTFGAQATRTHVKYARLFVLAQDYDDAMRSLRANLDPVAFGRLAHEDTMSLTLFQRVAAVITDSVLRGEHIAAITMKSEPDLAELASLESLEARQFTERALIDEGLAALEADIAQLRACLAESRAEHRAEAARQLQDVAPFPQQGSAAAELSMTLSTQRMRHRT
jgi:hypothetical protein